MNIVQAFVTQNPLYQQYTRIQVRKLVLHSVGCPQPSAAVFARQWQTARYFAHAVLQADGTVYQTMPWETIAWHCGGSANSTHIGVEMTEPSAGMTYAEAAEQIAGTYHTAVELFGTMYRYPFFAAPLGAMKLHYGEKYTDREYNSILVNACADSGIAAFTGDGTNPDVMTMATKAIGNADGCGVPTIKPWNIDTIKEKMAQAKASGCFAVAMDVDAAGLPFLKNMTPPAGSKSVAELAEIVKLAERPFIVKGVMTVKGALKAKEAGAAAIVVSNHGGRVLDQCPATAEVLPEIAAALKGTGVKVLVDGGIRTGVDVFKALALGADGVLICRPFVTAVYGGGEEGVKCYIDKLAGELADTMQMCGAHSISEITADMVRV